MLSIRKFVGCVKVAAGLGAAALGLGLSIQVAGAHVAAAPATQAVRVTTLSQPCQDALQAVRDFLVSDRQEDGVELATPPTSDTDEDAGEIATLKSLWTTVKTQCADQIAAIKASTGSGIVNKPSVSSQCTAAVQAWKTYAKSLWTQGSAPTAAQKTQLQQYGQAVRTACGWPSGTWSAGDWRH
jgi:hypothetical protein